MTEATAPSHEFLAGFSDRRRLLQQSGPDWLRRARAASLERFDELGFPTSRLEEWKNTNVTPIVETRFAPAAAQARPAAELPELGRLETGGPRLVFVDGRLMRELSTLDGGPPGLWLGGLEAALESRPQRVRQLWSRRAPEADGAFSALNGALAEDGATVLVEDGATVEQPIHLLYVATATAEPTASHPRTLIATGRNSRAVVIESFVGPADAVYLTNAVTDVAVGADSRLDHYRVQLEGERAFHVSTLESRQAADSRYHAVNVDLGGRLVRHDLRCVLEGQGGNANLDGLYVTDGRQHLDNHTVLDHARPHCDSRELYKGVLAGRSRTVFNGRIIVRPDAQRTDAKQSNPNLLISDQALAHTRPQLEIYADDVKCTHGATVGRLDEDAVFYLRSRAIAEAAARRMLVEAFAGELLERIAVAPLQALLGRQIETRLERCLGG